MTLEKYIKELLYRYDCVIVPEFGAFITNHKSAIVDNSNFKPPFKQLTFNSLIQNNDGLLANYIAQTDKMPYKTALNFIKFEVEEWIDKLLDEDLTLDGIGDFYIIDDTIHFEPDNTINFLTSSFGLSAFNTNIISRETQTTLITDKRTSYKTQVEQIEEKAPIYISNEKRNKSSYFVKYAAIFLIGGTLIGLLGKKIYENRLDKQQIIALQKQQQAKENQIQTATFIIDTPLPTITINTKESIKNIHIIAGAFRSEKNALKKVNQLKNNGFNASIVGKNKWNLTQVAFDSFSSIDKANKTLATIKNTVTKDAWLLIKE